MEDITEREAPVCFACSSVREVQSVEPITAGYELRSFVCPRCQTTLKLVCDRRQRRKVESD
jgi:hypothetical protein